MSSAGSRRTISNITLAVFAVATVVMAVWGFQAVTKPVEKDPISATETPGCTDETVAKKLRRSAVVVSVYNAGERSGRAQKTMTMLENAGFRPGAFGNAPDGLKVAKAEVHTTKANDPAATLVAQALGPKTKIVVDSDDRGPGIDVFIGDKFRKLDPKAPTSIKLPSPQTLCE